MKNIIYFFIGFLIIIFSGSIFNFIEIPFINARPDLIFLYITFLALFIGSERAGIIGLILGLMMDIFMGRFLGFNALILFFAGIFFGIFKDKIFKETFGGSVILLLTGVLIKNLLSIILFRTQAFGLYDVGLKLLFIMTLNLFVGILLYYPMRALIYKIEQ